MQSGQSPDLMPAQMLERALLKPATTMPNPVTQEVTANTKLTPAMELLEKIMASSTSNEASVAQSVWGDYSRAKTNRDNAGITLKIEQAMRARKGEYENDEKALHGGVNTIWWPLTDRMCGTAIAFLSNLLLSTNDALWDIMPTPLPDIPAYATEQALANLTNRFTQAYVQAIQQGGAPMGIAEQREMVKQAKLIVLDESSKAAIEGLEQVKKIISDRMQEGNWTSVLDVFIDHFCTFPYAVLCGPEATIEPCLEWTTEGAGFGTYDKLKTRFRVVHPSRFYWSQDSRDCQTGSFVIEDSEMSRSQLAKCLSLSGFIKPSVQEVLDHYANANRNWMTNAGSAWPSAGGLSPQGSSGGASADNAVIDALSGRVHTWADDETIRVLRRHGKMTGASLRTCGVDDPSVMDGLSYECEVWVIGQHVIRAVINPSKMGIRPYHHASYRRVPDSFSGEAPPSIVRPYQQVCNALIRGFTNNVGYATYPVREVNVNRMVDGVVPSGVNPGTILHTQDGVGTGGDAQAMRTDSQPLIAPALMAQLLSTEQSAETAVGLPRFLSGDQGSAGRNLGIFSALQSNVSVTLKRALTNLDNMLIVPLVKSMYYAALDEMDTTNQEIPPLDANIVAMGSTVILQREQNKAKVAELIQVLQPAVQGGLMPPEALAKAYRMYLEQMGYKGIMPEDDAVKAYVEKLLASGMMRLGGGGGTGSPAKSDEGGGGMVPNVPTDGRGPAPEAPLS